MTRPLAVFLLLVACAPTELGFESAPPIKGISLPIVGGAPVVIADAPWQVSLQRGGRHACGGSILSPEWIITAAHCVSGGTEGMSVVAGSSLISRPGERQNVASATIFPGYSEPSLGKDFALLRLSSPLTLDGVQARAIQVITPAHESFIAPGVNASVTGWGDTSEGGGGATDRLLGVTVPIVALADAERTYGPLSRDQLPAGFAEGGRDACQGDSGGPLTVIGPDGKAWLAGVVSWGEGCARAGSYGMYARVASFDEFIRSTTGGIAPPTEPAPGTPPTVPPAEPTPGTPPTEPAPGTPPTTMSGTTSIAANARMVFGPYTLTPGATLFATLTGSGDPDLYMAFGEVPTFDFFDCRSWRSGADENCSLSGGGEVFIMVYAYEDSTFNLGTELIGSGGVPGSTPGVPGSTPGGRAEMVAFDGFVGAGDLRDYAALRLAGGSMLEVTLSGDGNADLLVSFEGPPADSPDCAPLLPGSNETCSLTVPAGGAEAFIAVGGVSASSYHMSIRYTPAL